MPRAIHLSGTAEGNRSVVGTMNEFAFLAEAYRDDMEATDELILSVRLAGTLCGALKYNSPCRMLKDLLAAQSRWN